MSYIIAIDEGTTSTRAVLYDLKSNKIVKQSSSEIKQIYPHVSFVEEDANSIYAQTLSSLVEILESVDDLKRVVGIGITNQRETVVAWDRKTGKPLYNAVIWQCRRTADYMNRLAAACGAEIRQKTGLVMDAYFSASKIRWLIDNVPEIKNKLRKKEVCFGTIDSFLIYKFTEGKSFVTDVTNASRTMLMNLSELRYDKDLLDLFGIPEDSLPQIISCDGFAGEFIYNGVHIPICGIAGDQQAALVGQGCLSAGTGKITYGTGLFMLSNLGDKPIISQNGLITTVGYKIGKDVAYAFEGSVFNAGSTIQWLRDNLKFFEYSADSEKLATQLEDNGGVYFVPAFTGLGAPYWNGEAKGVICGLTRGTGIAHITRAALEAMAYSARDLTEVMEKESGIKFTDIRCDGGASGNDFLMQFQASVLKTCVNRPVEKESTALGAAYLCGIGRSVLSADNLSSLRKVDRIFLPENVEKYDAFYSEWKNAIKKCII